MAKQNSAERKTVCGGTLKNPEKFPSVEYRGERLYFCIEACLQAFEQDPEWFLAGEIEHPTN